VRLVVSRGAARTAAHEVAGAVAGGGGPCGGWHACIDGAGGGLEERGAPSVTQVAAVRYARNSCREKAPAF
jgi:hypothetical protein